MKLYYVDSTETFHVTLSWETGWHTVSVTDYSAQELMARGDVELIFIV